MFLRVVVPRVLQLRANGAHQPLVHRVAILREGAPRGEVAAEISDGVGVPIEVGCHRPDRVAAIAGADPSNVLTPERLVRVLLDEAGSRKAQPAGARFAVLLNRVTAADAALVDDIQSRVAALDSKVAVLAVGDVERAGLPDVV